MFCALDVMPLQAESELIIHVTYEATTLLQGPAAEAHLARYSPQLRGSGAVVNVGQMQLAGVPLGFL